MADLIPEGEKTAAHKRTVRFYGRNQNPREYVLSRIEYDTNGGCWLWAAYVGSNGYGSATQKNDIHLAHRFSYRAFRGEIADGLCVLHKCDVRSCVNPDHLFLGTNKDNMADMHAKGRRKPGTMRWARTPDIIKRAVWERPDLSSYKLSDLLGIDRGKIRQIRREAK